jgi:hypothetical protein
MTKNGPQTTLENVRRPGRFGQKRNPIKVEKTRATKNDEIYGFAVQQNFPK